MRIVVKIFEFFLFFLVVSLLFVYTNHTCLVLQSEIEQQYGIFRTGINKSVQCLIQGGIAYAQDSIAPDGHAEAGNLAHIASLKRNRVKQRWLTFEEVRQFFKINPHDVSELRKKWPYAQIISRSDGTHLVWISQGVILPSSEKNVKELPLDEPDNVASHRHGATQEIHHNKTQRKYEEKQFVSIAYAAPIDFESSRNTDKIVKRDSCIGRMIIDEKKEKEMMHMVVWGESLSGIAQRYDLEWQDIYQRNRKIIGNNPNCIEPGQLLHIPSTVYVVKKGDSLSKISKRLGIAWQKIYDLNKNVIGDNPNCIEPGQKFTLFPHSPQTFVADSRQPFSGSTSAPLKCESIQDSQECEHTGISDVLIKKSRNEGDYPIYGNVESLWHRPFY